MASLQARHQRECAIVVARRKAKQAAGKSGSADQWSKFADATKAKGCSCTPLYHVVLRHDGKLIREPVGHNRKEAALALDGRRGDVARREYQVVADVPFNEWADRWLAGHTGKLNTRRVYGETINAAKRAFGKRKVRDLDAGDVRRFLDQARDETRERRSRKLKPNDPPPAEVTPATLARHLRTLGACLQAAVSEGYATTNPVRQLHKSARPKVDKSRPSYYTTEELARLWPELAYRPVFLALCKTAVTTGLRLGELAALRWSDVDLLDRELHVRRAFDGTTEATPKSNEPRTVDLTEQAAGVLEAWFAKSAGGGDGLVFEREEGGYMTSGYVCRQVLYPALERSGIPRLGEGGRERDFHSFRHTFARLALEAGGEITFVKEQLGHSSITLTVDTYGHWSRASRKAQADKLASAFPV